MEITKEMNEEIQELQILEHNLHELIMEKQSFQVELNEINNAIEELKKAAGDVYKMLGGIMIQASPDSLSKEILERKKVLELRISAIEKQEKLAEEKTEKLRKKISSSFSEKNKDFRS